MSQFGDEMDFILALTVQADPSITTSRGLRAFDSIPADDFPHALAYDPRETRERLDFAQDQITRTYTFAVVDSITQEAMAVLLDAIVVLIKADETLGGIVDDSFVSLMLIDETPDDKRTAGVFEVTTLKVA